MLSLLFDLIALVLVFGVSLALVGLLAATVFHMWGTSTVGEWLAELAARILLGHVRRRFIRAVTNVADIRPDRTKRACRHVVVSIAAADVRRLSVNGDLDGLSRDAVRAYRSHARSEGWKIDADPQVLVVVDERSRPGCVRANSVSRARFHEIRLDRVIDGYWCADFEPEPRRRGGATVTRLLEDESVTSLGGDDEIATVPTSRNEIHFRDARGNKYIVSSTSTSTSTLTSATAGRSRDCQIKFTNLQVSRQHVAIYLQYGQWWLRDCDSSNGTLVDGDQIKGSNPAPLRRGSSIVLGSEGAGERLLVTSVEIAPV